MPFNIRPFHPEDWQDICQIHDLARPDELVGSCDPRAFVPIEKDSEVELLKLSLKFVSVENDQITGFVGVHENYLAWLYVHPDHYGNGIGRSLLQKGIEHIPGKAWTIALAGNTKAVKLYQSEGFVEVNRYQSDNAGYPCTCLRLEQAI